MTNDQTRLGEHGDEPHAKSEVTITVGHVDEPHDRWGARKQGEGMDERSPPKKGWLGNPYTVGHYGRERAIELYDAAFRYKLENDFRFTNALLGLPGQVVACYCRHTDEDTPACHLDVVRQHLLEGRVGVAASEIHGIETPSNVREMDSLPSEGFFG